MRTKVSNKQDIIDILQTNSRGIKSLGVKKLALFGSFVRNEQKPKSDVDILVEFQPGQKTFKNYINLCFLSEKIFNRKTDIVTKESLNKYIGPYILNEAEYVQI